MKKKIWILALVGFSSFAAAHDYPLRPTDLSSLKPPRADMPAAIFDGHAAFVELAKSAHSIDVPDDFNGSQPIVLRLSTGGSRVFYPTAATPKVFESDISSSPMSAYPGGRLLLHFEELEPRVDRDTNPLVAATLYIVGKYPFAHWGYGNVETPTLYSQAKWIRTGIDSLGTRESTDHCDPHFPCVPKLKYVYRFSFANPLTGEKTTEVTEQDQPL